MVLVFIMYPVWESILYKLTGIISDSNPIIKHYLVVGPVEELTKFIVFIVLSSAAKSIKEPRDGILQAASIALGFAGAEKHLRKAKDLNSRSSWTKIYYGAACLLNGKEHEGLYFIQKSLKEMSGKNGDKAVSSLGKIIRKEEDKNKLMKFLYREGYSFEYKTTQMELRRRNALKKDRVLSIRGESMLVNQTEYMEYCLSPGGSQKGMEATMKRLQS